MKVHNISACFGLAFFLAWGSFANENYCHNDNGYLDCQFSHTENLSEVTMGIITDAHLTLSMHEEAAKVLDAFREDGIYSPPINAELILDRNGAPSIRLRAILAPVISIVDGLATGITLNISVLEGDLPSWLLNKAKKYLNTSSFASEALTDAINDALEQIGLFNL